MSSGKTRGAYRSEYFIQSNLVLYLACNSLRVILVNHYKWFIQYFALVAGPLYHLLKRTSFI